MQKTEQVTLGGVTYNITQLPLKKARRLLIKITNLIGPALGDAVSSAKTELDGGGPTTVSVDSTSIGKAIRTLAYDLDEETLEQLQHELFQEVSFKNKAGHDVPVLAALDEHFAGGQGLARLMKLTWEALRVNYSDFLAELGLEGLVQMSPLQGHLPTSTGMSGGLS